MGSTEQEKWKDLAKEIAVVLDKYRGAHKISEIAKLVNASEENVARALYEICRVRLPQIGISGDDGEEYIKKVRSLQKYENLPIFNENTKFYHVHE